MFQQENSKRTVRNSLTATLLALMVLTTAGCGGSGYYPGAGAGGYYGGSPRTMGSSSVPPGYHYSDPSFCSGSGGGICPLLLGAAVVGIAVIAGH
jgi:hypothetical protein